jgi:hypothetical protein
MLLLKRHNFQSVCTQKNSLQQNLDECIWINPSLLHQTTYTHLSQAQGEVVSQVL